MAKIKKSIVTAYVRDGKVIFRNNGKKQDREKNIKKFVKSNIETFNAESFADKKLKTFVKRVEKGRDAAETRPRLKGKYVSEIFLKANPQLQETANKRGVSLKELFEDKKIAESALKLYNNKDGWNVVYHSDEIIKQVDTFGGEIQINGKKVTKMDAILSMAAYDSFLKRKFDSFYNEFTVNYIKGGATINLTIPEDYENLFDDLDEDDLEDFNTKANTSPGGKKNKEEYESKEKVDRGESELPKKEVKKKLKEYTVKSFNEKGNRSVIKIKAFNKGEAIGKFNEARPNNNLISLDFKTNGKNKKR